MFAAPQFIGTGYVLDEETNMIVRTVNGVVNENDLEAVREQRAAWDENDLEEAVRAQFAEDNRFENMQLESTPMGENPYYRMWQQSVRQGLVQTFPEYLAAKTKPWTITILNPDGGGRVLYPEGPCGITYITNLTYDTPFELCEGTLGAGMTRVFQGDLYGTSNERRRTGLRHAVDKSYIRVEHQYHGKRWEMTPDGLWKRNDVAVML